jgi:hypothetical protein
MINAPGKHNVKAAKEKVTIGAEIACGYGALCFAASAAEAADSDFEAPAR